MAADDSPLDDDDLILGVVPAAHERLATYLGTVHLVGRQLGRPLGELERYSILPGPALPLATGYGRFDQRARPAHT